MNSWLRGSPQCVRLLQTATTASVFVFILFLLPLHCLAGQEAAAQEKTAEQVFKNIQALKGVPASQVSPIMHYMENALGVNCSFCHVNDAEFEKDGKKAKDETRAMIKMTREVNQANFNGRTEISCNTCHRGQVRPAQQLPFAEITDKPPVRPARPEERRPQEAMPSVDQILDKYIQATGGQAAMDKISTRVLKGTRSTSMGMSAPLEVYQKSPGKLFAVTRFESPMAFAFDGAVAWVQNRGRLMNPAAPEMARIKREAVLFRPLLLKTDYQNVRVAGKQKVGDKEVYVIMGTPAGSSPERFYFDAQSGLLLRVTYREETAIGNIPEEVDYDDYRDVDGVKVPFMAQRLRPDFAYKDVFTEVVQNVPVDDKKFEKPSEPLK
jgi:photosynthetic reaction center cytochrome c subunit